MESHTAQRGARTAIVAASGVLALILGGTRVIGLDRSYWHDEIVTVRDFVSAGPREILAGPYIPNNHELFSLLGWVTSSVAGESEVALRLWSAIPFVLGVILVTAWLQARVGVLTAVLYLFFTTLSPLLLDLSRQARGYGLAFLAMSVLIVAALEADRSGRTWTIVAFCLAGTVGTWTLPIFGLAFLATGGVLLSDPALRRRAALGLAASALAIGAWYVPHFADLLTSSRQEYSAPIPWFGIVTAPIDQILIPALLWIEGLAPTPSVVWLPLIAAIALVLFSSPLLRERRTGLILGASVVATFVAVWATRLGLAPRFLSFLLVPLFVFLASGTAHVLARTAARRPSVRTAVAVTLLALAAIQFPPAVTQVMRFPREAHKEAAELIDEQTLPGSTVFAYTHQPPDLAFYLDVPVRALDSSEVVSSVCHAPGPVVYVTQPFSIRRVDVPCLRHTDVRHFRVRQYTRGEGIDVWFVPAGS